MVSNVVVLLQTFAIFLVSLVCLCASLFPRIERALRSVAFLRVAIEASLALLCLHGTVELLLLGFGVLHEPLLAPAWIWLGVGSFSLTLIALFSSLLVPVRLGELVSSAERGAASRIVTALILAAILIRLMVALDDGSLVALLIEDSSWVGALPPSLLVRFDFPPLFLGLILAGLLGSEVRQHGLRVGIWHVDFSRVVNWDVNLSSKTLILSLDLLVRKGVSLRLSTDGFAETFEHLATCVGTTSAGERRQKSHT